MAQIANRLSVLVPCGNSAGVIEDCLKSVQWADEILVVDSFSTDGTFEIAERYATRVLRHAYPDSATQKNWAIPQVAHDWVLIVDTDERVSEDLKNEIVKVLADPGETVGYRIPRLNYAWGVPLRHGGNYPDYQLRLFRKDCGKYDSRRVHAHVVLEGPGGLLTHPLIHLGQRSMNQVIHHLLGDFTTWEAEERLRRGRHFTVAEAGARPIAAFFSRWIWQKGFMDGTAGFLMAGFWAAYVFLTYAKMWEMTRQGGKGDR